MKRYLVLLPIIILITTLAVTPALAMSPAQTSFPSDFLREIIDVGTSLATLAGVASLISVIVNILKYFKLITDGTGGRVFALLNLIAFFALASLRIFGPQYSLQYLDGIAGQIATIGLFISGYVFQLGTGQMAYGILKKLEVPILSHSGSNINPLG